MKKNSSARPVKAVFVSATAMASLWAVGQATAADPPPDNTGAEKSTDDLPTVIVTAQRREEQLQDVPITIAHFDADTLKNADVQSLSEIDKLTSGLRFDKRTNFSVPTIRGITTPIVLAGGGSNIGVYLDGFYSPALQGSDLQLMNVDSIQVLKGPQGTLFGRNTNGGAILIHTAPPSHDGNVVVEAGYGSYNALRSQVYATTGLGERVAVDVAGAYNQGDGWVTNIANGDDKVGQYQNVSFRVGVKVDVTDDFSLLARYSLADVDDPTNLLQTPYVLSNGAPAAIAASRPGAIVTTKRGEISGDEPFVYKYHADIFQLTGALNLDSATITSYTQYRSDRQRDHKYSLDYTNIPLAGLDILDYNDTFTQELLLTSTGDNRLQYTFGAFYFQNNSRFPVVYIAPGGAPFRFTAASGVNNKSIATYGDLTYEVMDHLFLTGGLRYTLDRVEDAYFKTAPTPAGTTTLPTLKTNRVTPRAVVRYELSDAASVYASFAKGYKAAIYNVGGNSTVPIDPENLDAFEVGFKHARGALSADVSSYYYKYGDQQLTNGVLINGVPLTRITNAAKSDLYGVEGDLQYQVSHAFSVRAGVSWSHARYKDFPNAPFFRSDYTIGLADGSGNQMQRAPDLNANLGATYTKDLAHGTLVLSGNLFYTSKFYFDVSEQLPQDAYSVLGLRAEWTDRSDRFVVALSGKNVTDEEYYTQVASNAFGVAAVWAPPATVEASIKFKLH
jgi:iron complex outermembrane receptor protein